MIATAAMVTDHENAKTYLKRLWGQATPSGKWRYYDGLLHMFALLHLSGQYRIIHP
jgi:oligosaccharide reducing-end xylanase